MRLRSTERPLLFLFLSTDLTKKTAMRHKQSKKEQRKKAKKKKAIALTKG